MHGTPHDPETKFRRRFLVEQLDLLPAIFLFLELVALVHVFFAVFQHAVDDACQFGPHGFPGFGNAQFGAHAGY